MQPLDLPPMQPGEVVAIIDVGSNSVRFISCALERMPTVLRDKEGYPRLGEEVAATGLLNPAGVETALELIPQFVELARHDGIAPGHIIIVATSAVRDAKDGAAFATKLERACRIPVHVISGGQEAYYGALGVKMGVWEPQGLGVDFGGSSFQFFGFAEGEVDENRLASLPLGPLNLRKLSGGDAAKAAEIVRAALQGIPWLKEYGSGTFYGVGGAMRQLAKLHIWEEDFPLSILDGHRIDAGNLRKLLKRLVKGDKELLDEVSGKRRDMILYNAVVLLEILELLKPEAMIVVAHGIRGGLVFSRLSAALQQQDPLLAACAKIAGKDAAYAEAISAWMAPFFPHATEHEVRLRHAACLLHKIGEGANKGHTALSAFEAVIGAEMGSLPIGDRVFLALSSYFRHTSHRKYVWHEKKELVALLEEKAVSAARLIGTLARVAEELSNNPTSTQDSILSLRKNPIHPAVGGAKISFSPDCPQLIVNEVTRLVTKKLNPIAHEHAKLVSRSGMAHA